MQLTLTLQYGNPQETVTLCVRRIEKAGKSHIIQPKPSRQVSTVSQHEKADVQDR